MTNRAFRETREQVAQERSRVSLEDSRCASPTSASPLSPPYCA
jgi:hypothetical protein